MWGQKQEPETVDKSDEKSFQDMVRDDLPQPTAGRVKMSIRMQTVEAHFYRSANTDPANGSPAMPVICMEQSGLVHIVGAIAEWWGSTYDPVAHAGGYRLQVLALRQGKGPWTIETAAIAPLPIEPRRSENA